MVNPGTGSSQRPVWTHAPSWPYRSEEAAKTLFIRLPFQHGGVPFESLKGDCCVEVPALHPHGLQNLSALWFLDVRTHSGLSSWKAVFSWVQRGLQGWSWTLTLRVVVNSSESQAKLPGHLFSFPADRIKLQNGRTGRAARRTYSNECHQTFNI